MKISGVYLITCTPPGELPRYYVGQSGNIGNRWVRHRYQLKAGKHHNARLQALYDLYGLPSIAMEVLELAVPAVIDDVEQWWIDMMFGYRRCVNISRDAIAPSRGMIMSPEHIRKATANRSPAKLDAEQRAAIGLRFKEYRERPASLESRMKISASKTGSKNHFHGRSGALSPVARPVVGSCLKSGKKIYFECARSARSDGFVPSCISMVCLGRRPSHKGYLWEYGAVKPALCA